MPLSTKGASLSLPSKTLNSVCSASSQTIVLWSKHMDITWCSHFFSRSMRLAVTCTFAKRSLHLWHPQSSAARKRPSINTVNVLVSKQFTIPILYLEPLSLINHRHLRVPYLYNPIDVNELPRSEEVSFSTLLTRFANILGQSQRSRRAWAFGLGAKVLSKSLRLICPLSEGLPSVFKKIPCPSVG